MAKRRPIPPAPKKAAQKPAPAPTKGPSPPPMEPNEDLFLPAERLPPPPALPKRPPGVGVKRKGPPLFIKIEKYQDVVNTIHKLKTFSLSLRDALDALADVEKELQNGVSIAHKALDRFNQTISTLDTKISRLPPMEDFQPEEKEEIDEMEDYVRNLHRQVQKIRKDLKTAEV